MLVWSLCIAQVLKEEKLKSQRGGRLSFTSEKVPNETIAGTGCHDFAWTHRSRVRERD